MLYHLLLSGIFFLEGGRGGGKGRVNVGPGFFFSGGGRGGGCFKPKGFS